MQAPRPSDIDLPPTTSVDLSHLVAVALAVAASTTELADEPERAA